jgi:hypothetical protein
MRQHTARVYADAGSVALHAILLMAIACARENDAPAAVDSARRDAQVAPVAGRADTVAAHAVTWNVASVERQLRAVGLLPTGTREVVRQPFLSVPGIVFRMPGADVQAFFYADAVAVARDAGPIDTTRVAPPTMMIEWRKRPHLVTDNNLLAIILTDDQRLAARIQGALRASKERHERQ